MKDIKKTSVQVNKQQYNQYLNLKLQKFKLSKNILKLILIIKKLIIYGNFPHKYSYQETTEKIIQIQPGYRELLIRKVTEKNEYKYGTAYYKGNKLIFFKYK